MIFKSKFLTHASLLLRLFTLCGGTTSLMHSSWFLFTKEYAAETDTVVLF